jgi:hypothetical protein
MARSTSWVGTDFELLEFLNAIRRNCTCTDVIGGSCAAHELAQADQATINRLIFARRIADRLCREEWRTSTRRPHPSSSTSTTP